MWTALEPGQVVANRLGLYLPFELGHLAGSEHEGGPTQPLLKGLGPAPVVHLTGGHSPLAQAALDQFPGGSLQAVVWMAAREPCREGVLEVRRPHRSLLTRVVARLVAADVPAALTVTPYGPAASHGSPAAASKHTHQRMRGVAIPGSRACAWDKALPLPDRLRPRPDFGRHDRRLFAGTERVVRKSNQACVRRPGQDFLEHVAGPQCRWRRAVASPGGYRLDASTVQLDSH
ncbi:MAG TPA: hypothetical protein VGR77_11825 [Candidatus Dormibacteraeota bacterium]|nr:hypothetical protein [Candidatus Dormibacteraeota bacterium]